MTIAKEEFEKYVRFPMNGVTNMFELELVSSFSLLEKDKIMEIMETYDSLLDEYPDVRNI